MSKLYVIKFNNGVYFIGNNKVDTQLRKAKIYTSLKWANDSANDFMKRVKHVTRYRHNGDKKYEPIESYSIVEVEIKEVHNND